MTELPNDHARQKRWRLILGASAEELLQEAMSSDELRMDGVLEALYDADRKGGLGSSSPNVARWLGDIRTYFPSSVVRVMQQDALERLDLQRMLTEPEMLEAVDPDIHLVATLLSLSRVIPNRTKETARRVVRKVVSEIEARLRNPLIQALRGSLNRATRSRRPRTAEINWHRTIRKNLQNYIPDRKTIIAESIIGFGRRRSSLRDVVLCVDQSGSMASSVVYAGIFGAVLASIAAIRTRMVVFDTAVVDLTEDLRDPVDLLFGTQLGGGTDIARALTYCSQLVEQPSKTILILISDLFEGGDRKDMLKRTASMVASGVHVIALLALSDDGAPSYDHDVAAQFAALGVPSFACTPDLFPDLMAAAIQKRDLGMWAARHDIATVRGRGG